MKLAPIDHAVPVQPEPTRGRDVPITAKMRKERRFDIPVIIARAAELELGGLAEIRIVAIDSKPLDPPPHPILVKIQQTNFYCTIPKVPGDVLDLKKGMIVDAYVRKVD